MKINKIIFNKIIFAAILIFLGFNCVNAQDLAALSKKAILTESATCEDIKDYAPLNPAIVFPISSGKICCFTSFDQVSERTYIFHNWLKADRLSTKKRLTLNPPKWATFSSIQLRESDKGPWRVEITDSDGNILQILRFSVTD